MRIYGILNLPITKPGDVLQRLILILRTNLRKLHLVTLVVSHHGGMDTNLTSFIPNALERLNLQFTWNIRRRTWRICQWFDIAFEHKKKAWYDLPQSTRPENGLGRWPQIFFFQGLTLEANPNQFLKVEYLELAYWVIIKHRHTSIKWNSKCTGSYKYAWKVSYTILQSQKLIRDAINYYYVGPHAKTCQNTEHS